jgi:hypothetical protein
MVRRHTTACLCLSLDQALIPGWLDVSFSWAADSLLGKHLLLNFRPGRDHTAAELLCGDLGSALAFGLLYGTLRSTVRVSVTAVDSPRLLTGAVIKEGVLSRASLAVVLVTIGRSCWL